VLGILLTYRPLFPQVNQGRILGAITDQSGGAIAGATVTVIDVARGVTRPLVTASAGQYNAPGLIRGTNSVRAEWKGFETVERQNILLQVGADVRVDLTLQPGEQTQTITVTEQLPIMNTTNAQLGGQVEDQQFNNLPITGRQFWHLLDYQPGVLVIPGGDSENYSSNGGRVLSTLWMFDGIDDLDLWSGTGPIAGERQASIMPVDAIEGVKVVQNPNAEYGWRSASVVNMGIKSGTNNIHGSVYFYGRNDVMDARNAFQSPALGRPADKVEDYGVSFGGPIKKDKLFYFGSFEGEYFEVANITTVTGPTTLLLPAGGNCASNPALGNCANSLPDAVADINKQNANAVVGNTTLSNLSLALAGCPSAASLASITNTALITCNPSSGVFGSFPASTSQSRALNDAGHSNNGIVKLDYHPSDHHALNFELFYGNGQEYSPASIQQYWAEDSPQNSQIGRAVWIWTPNSTWVNEARFGYDESNGPTYPAECTNNLGQPNYASAFGYTPGTAGNPPGCKAFAPVTIGNFTSLGSDSGGGSDYINYFSFLDSVSYTRGKHLFKFGGELHLIGFYGAGKLTGLTGTTDFGNSGISAFAGATPLEDFLTGTVDSGTLLIGNIQRHVSQERHAAFLQDDWRVTSRVTLNLGVRYEYISPITEQNNNLANFDPTTATGLAQETSGNPVYHTNPHSFGPRLGAVWDVTGKGTTVVRLGGSLVADDIISFNDLLKAGNGAQLQANPTGWNLTLPNGTVLPKPGNINVGIVSLTGNTPGQAPLGQLTWLQNTPIFNSTGAAALACGNGLPQVAPGNPAITNPAPCSLNVINPHLPTSYVTTWTLSVQHAFTSNLALNVAYVGNHGTSLSGVIDINAPNPGAKGTSGATYATNENLRRGYASQFPYFGQIRYYTGDLESNYDGLQMQLTERVTHGLNFNAGYTFAHALDDVSTVQAFSAYNNANPNLNYGNSTYDVRNHFTLTGSYIIPGIKSPAQLLEGWQINSELNLLGAFPFNAVDTTSDLSGTGEKFDRWNLVGSPSAFTGGGVAQLPCFGVSSSSFAGAANCITVAIPAGAVKGTDQYVSNLPAACVSAASSEQYGTTPNPANPSDKNATGLLALGNFGCYYQNGSAIVPPAQGSFGTMTRDLLRDHPFREWDFSVMKNMKIKERYNAQFRAEIFNVLNSTEYAVPSGNPNSPSTFGQAQSAPSGGATVFKSGGPRTMMLGLKVTF